MNRRQLFLSAAALMGVSATPALAAPIRTQWKVGLSEGFDALCFLWPPPKA
ncbi:hypothetical protein [Caulobacter sp. 1776]|uniref:hypothetical protein n=1 Tax=Caulobacter sp. 1776 TaxID=3156420 RepID=UPI00339AE44F